MIDGKHAHRDVITNKVPVALLRLELHGEAADIAQAFGRPVHERTHVTQFPCERSQF